MAFHDYKADVVGDKAHVAVAKHGLHSVGVAAASGGHPPRETGGRVVQGGLRLSALQMPPMSTSC